MYQLLLIDDEQAILAARKTFLEKQGNAIHTAQNSNQAIELICNNTYDCILLDVMLEETTGFSLCTKIKTLTRTPIIFLSSRDDTESQLQAFALGGDDYITKDTSLELFWAKLKRRLELQDKPEKEIKLSFPPLTLNLKQRVVSIAGEVIPLTNLEIDLLGILMERPNQVWRVEEIYSRIWGPKGINIEQTVQTSISRMRRKLEKAYSKHYFIETVRGQGYRFVPYDEN